jgi:hypothetical protein
MGQPEFCLSEMDFRKKSPNLWTINLDVNLSKLAD